MMFGMRLGPNPRGVVTTTPQPLRLLRELIAEDGKSVHVTRGSTYENLGNLSTSFRRTITKYEGTRLGRQELHAEMLDDVEGALWTYALIEHNRVAKAPELVRIVVAVDPAVTSSSESDETGIIVAGEGHDGHGYILEDLSGRYSPDGWAGIAVSAYHRHRADRIVGEVNNGGDLVETVIRGKDSNVSYKAVHASRNKQTRAEPVAALDEQSRIHHVGMFPELEDQMCNWVQGMKSPDRVDARVWAISELVLEGSSVGFW